MRRLFRTPLLHFLVIGGVILVARRWWAPLEVSHPRIVIGAPDVERLRDVWQQEHGAPPTAAAEQTLVHAAVDEEVLYREALARGFDRQDDTVRERLARLGGFVGEEALGGRDALEAEARRLGLERSDLVVRRHLVEMMRLATGRVDPADLPSEEELQAYLGEHAAEFAQPARVQLTHVYLSEERRGAAMETAARTLLDELGQTPGVSPETAARRGDAFIAGARFDASPSDLQRTFGAGFAEAIDAAPVETWVGPIRSSYGLHLVWVRGRQPARVPPLAEVRGRVLHQLVRERSAQREKAAMAGMRARYDVDVPATVARR